MSWTFSVRLKKQQGSWAAGWSGCGGVSPPWDAQSADMRSDPCVCVWLCPARSWGVQSPQLQLRLARSLSMAAGAGAGSALTLLPLPCWGVCTLCACTQRCSSFIQRALTMCFAQLRCLLGPPGLCTPSSVSWACFLVWNLLWDQNH